MLCQHDYIPYNNQSLFTTTTTTNQPTITQSSCPNPPKCYIYKYRMTVES